MHVLDERLSRCAAKGSYRRAIPSRRLAKGGPDNQRAEPGGWGQVSATASPERRGARRPRCCNSDGRWLGEPLPRPRLPDASRSRTTIASDLTAWRVWLARPRRCCSLAFPETTTPACHRRFPEPPTPTRRKTMSDQLHPGRGSRHGRAHRADRLLTDEAFRDARICGSNGRSRKPASGGRDRRLPRRSPRDWPRFRATQATSLWRSLGAGDRPRVAHHYLRPTLKKCWCDFSSARSR